VSCNEERALSASRWPEHRPKDGRGPRAHSQSGHKARSLLRQGEGPSEEIQIRVLEVSRRPFLVGSGDLMPPFWRRGSQPVS
jgi:hypothetical protein